MEISLMASVSDDVERRLFKTLEPEESHSANYNPNILRAENLHRLLNKLQ